jgi:outer membrane receptor protein involved in Fe transport
MDQPSALKSSEISRDPRQQVGKVETDSILHAVTLNYRRTLGGGWSAASNVFARQRVENTPLNLGRTSISNSRSVKLSNGGVVQLEHRADVLDRQSLLVAGVEASYDKSESDSNALFFAFPPATYSGAIIRGRNMGLFVQETLDLVPRILILTAGARWDRSSLGRDDKDKPSDSGWRAYNRASPRVGLDYNPLPWLQAYASLADSFRAPTGDEISALGPFNSTPFLAPVKSRSFETGVRLLGGRWGTASAGVFRTITRDEIFAVFDPTQGFGQNTNVPLTKRDGVELSLAPRWNETLDGVVNYSYTDATFGTDFVMDKAPFPATQHVTARSHLPMVPRQRLYAAANGHPAPGWTVTADELCVGAQHMFGDEANVERRLGAYCLAGFGVSRERGPLSLHVRVDNAFDRAYVVRGILASSGGVGERFLMPGSGIAVSGGARWRFGALNAKK